MAKYGLIYTTPKFSMERGLANQFNHFVPREALDTQEEEFYLYQTTKDLPSDILCEHQIDVYWEDWGAKIKHY